eukprot:TRINITY_DN13540_c0_g1_i9.p1 TRINITY_DN13540_c0_g1~~TRINITY_DN13540_c0_g1_i9.p1  ORF type:complete len:120 (-),score=17.69 TRINITY_DN13540_c0_g1_i9:433-792(-)
MGSAPAKTWRPDFQSKNLTCGWLSKKGGRGLNSYLESVLHKRYFILDPDQKILAYYANTSETNPLGIIDLTQVHELLQVSDLAFTLKTTQREYYLMASTEEEVLSWTSRLLILISVCFF